MRNIYNYIFQDWRVNQNNIKARFILVMFRLAQLLRQLSMPLLIVSMPYLIFYRIFVEWILGVELPWNTQIGHSLKLYHGQSLVINDHTIIGNKCTIRHSTTIGHKVLSDGSFSESPRIGDNVDIGSNVVIIGSVTIGNNAIIGAGCVVVKDIPERAVVVGNPAKIIRIIESKSVDYKEDSFSDKIAHQKT